ncbi:hypothetical protein Avbf_18995 [Armadillidium vulgare]|nr:hypothetical protein Avbf_18995 [Armadillidium vulgare]
MSFIIGGNHLAVFVFNNLFSSVYAKGCRCNAEVKIRTFEDEKISKVVKAEHDENWKDPFPSTTGRLPTWIKPFHYDLKLNVFLDNATYNGFVSLIESCK